LLLSKLSILLVALIIVPVSCVVVADDLLIYNWARNLGADTAALFENKTGHKIREAYYDNEGDRNRNILSANAINYDIFILDSDTANLFGESGLLQNIAELNVTGVENQPQKYIDACGPYGMPYAWGSIGIAYRTSIIKEEITSWSQLFNPPAEVGKRIMLPLDDFGTVSVLLLAIGKNMASENIDDFKQALELLKQQMPYVKDYSLGMTYAEQKGELSDIVMVMAFSGNAEEIVETTGQTDWKYVAPKEGVPLWVDCWAIPKTNNSPQLAIEFLSHLNDGKVAAKNSLEVWHSPTNNAALAHLSDEFFEDKEVNPSLEVMARSYPEPHLSSAALRLRQWLVFSAKTNFKIMEDNNR
jgi:spermidine/putrescine transport system substrate-binding protein